MIIEINVPNIGEDELEITDIMVKIGDNININQSLIVIEGDKTSMEIPAPCSGIITEICIHIGDKIRTGSLIFLINTNNHINNIKPNVQEKNTQTSDNTANNNKNIQKIFIHNVNQKNIDFLHTKDIIHATPLIRRIAREFEIDLSKIQGSGRKGRILKEDIQNYIRNKSHHISSNISLTHQYEQLLSMSSSPQINFQKFGDIKTITLNKIQKISGINLHKNWIMLPHVTQFDEADITDLEIFRKQQNIEIEKKKMNYKITPLIFVMKAVAKALEKLPHFNSSLSSDGTTLIIKKYINIGIAVDTEKGLLVPVLRDVNKKNIITLSQELTEISKKARLGNQLTPNDIQGGSFTISSLGNIGGTAFTPIINAPEVAILGISKAYMKPIWTGKEFTPRLILPLSLSYDHRVINGADGARFITLINKIISDIRLLSI